MGKVSYAVRKRYQDKAYARFTAFIPKETGQRFKEVSEKTGISMNSVFREAVDNFLKENT